MYDFLQQASELKQRLEDFSDKVRVNPKRGCMMLAVCRGKVRGLLERIVERHCADEYACATPPTQSKMHKTDCFVLLEGLHVVSCLFSYNN
jgi:hypothetical protein